MKIPLNIIRNTIPFQEKGSDYISIPSNAVDIVICKTTFMEKNNNNNNDNSNKTGRDDGIKMRLRTNNKIEQQNSNQVGR